MNSIEYTYRGLVLFELIARFHGFSYDIIIGERTGEDIILDVLPAGSIRDELPLDKEAGTTYWLLT